MRAQRSDLRRGNLGVSAGAAIGGATLVSGQAFYSAVGGSGAIWERGGALQEQIIEPKEETGISIYSLRHWLSSFRASHVD